MGVRLVYQRCKPCEKIYENKDGACPECGTLFGSKSRDKLRDVMGFREHYNSSIGAYVTSERDMHRKAEQLGASRYGHPIKMRKD